MNERGEQMKDLGVRVLAVVGFIAVLFSGLWGTVQIVKYTPNLFSGLAAVTTSLTSVFVPNEQITLNEPGASRESGSVFTLSFDHRNKSRAEGKYAFSYECRDGLSFQSPAEGGIYQRVACGTDFTLSGSVDGIILLPLSEKLRVVDVPVSVAFITSDSNKETARDSITLTITNDRIGDGRSGSVGGTSPGGVLTPGPTTTTTYPVGGGSASDQSGLPDLTPRILAVGYMNANNEFVATSSIPFGFRGAVRFEVVNIGTKASVQWTFNAVLPTFPMHIFHSSMQQALLPGERIEYTLGFDQSNTGLREGVVTINADPAGSIKERSELNNIIQATVGILQR